MITDQYNNILSGKSYSASTGLIPTEKEPIISIRLKTNSVIIISKYFTIMNITDSPAIAEILITRKKDTKGLLSGNTLWKDVKGNNTVEYDISTEEIDTSNSSILKKIFFENETRGYICDKIIMREGDILTLMVTGFDKCIGGFRWKELQNNGESMIIKCKKYK